MDFKYDRCSTDETTSSDSHLLPDSELDLRHQLNRTRRFSKENVLGYIFKTFVVCLALWGVLNIGYNTFRHIRAKVTPRELCDCGSSVEEAIARGCKFEEMSSAWLPPQCHDLELSEKYAKLGNRPDGTWNYWADLNRTVPLTAEEVGLLGGTGRLYYSDWEWHTAHCIYYWEKEVRMPETKVIMEPRVNSRHHIDHCRTVIFSNRELTSNAGVVFKGTTTRFSKEKGEIADY